MLINTLATDKYIFGGIFLAVSFQMAEADIVLFSSFL
jgi:hypothetical protein